MKLSDGRADIVYTRFAKAKREGEIVKMHTIDSLPNVGEH